MYQNGGKGAAKQQDWSAALKWCQLSAKADYGLAKDQLHQWQEQIIKLESVSPQDSPWQQQRLKALPPPAGWVKKKESIIAEEEERSGGGGVSFDVSDSSSSSGGYYSSGGDVETAVIEAENLGLGSSSNASGQLQASLSAHQLTCLLGSQYGELIECVKALGGVRGGEGGQSVDDDGGAANLSPPLLQVDTHSAALAELYALVKQSINLDVHVYSALIKVLEYCVPVYQLQQQQQQQQRATTTTTTGCDDKVENEALFLPSSRLEHAALLVQQAIDVVGHAHWLLRHQVLGKLRILEDEYATAISSSSSDCASVAVLGEGYYSLPVTVARQLLCVNETGKEVKTNQAGSHAVAALNGVHYKPNSKAESPINPGKEAAVSSLMQLIAGQSLAAAPSTLLSVSGVSIQKKGEEEEEKCIVTTMTGNLVQGGLTITGMCFKDFIECREALGVWESRLSMDAMVALLQDVQEDFVHALAVAKQQYPDVFGVFDLSVEANRTALSEGLRHAFEQVCAGKAVEVQLCDIANFSDRPEANRRNAFRGLFESFLRDGGGTVDGLCALLGVICQYPTLMARQEIAGLLQQFKHSKQLFKLLPNTPLETALTIMPQLLTKRYLDTEAMSFLWLGLLLTLPCDGKFDNFMLQLDYDTNKQLKHCRIVAIDNDLSLKMPFSLNEHGKLSLELKNLLLVLPELMDLPIHPTVRKHCLSLSSEGWYLTWLSLLAKHDSDYQQWLQQGTVSVTALRAIDIPVQLPQQVWLFIKAQWCLLHNILQTN